MLFFMLSGYVIINLRFQTHLSLEEKYGTDIDFRRIPKLRAAHICNSIPYNIGDNIVQYVQYGTIRYNIVVILYRIVTTLYNMMLYCNHYNIVIYIVIQYYSHIVLYCNDFVQYGAIL